MMNFHPKATKDTSEIGLNNILATYNYFLIPENKSDEGIAKNRTSISHNNHDKRLTNKLCWERNINRFYKEEENEENHYELGKKRRIEE